MTKMFCNKLTDENYNCTEKETETSTILNFQLKHMNKITVVFVPRTLHHRHITFDPQRNILRPPSRRHPRTYMHNAASLRMKYLAIKAPSRKEHAVAAAIAVDSGRKTRACVYDGNARRWSGNTRVLCIHARGCEALYAVRRFFRCYTCATKSAKLCIFRPYLFYNTRRYYTLNDTSLGEWFRIHYCYK